MSKEKEIEQMAYELHCATNESLMNCRATARILIEKCGYHTYTRPTGFKTYSDSVLMKQTKAWLIDQIRLLERMHCDDQQHIDIQAENCERLIAEAKEEIDRLQTELSHREENLVHLEEENAGLRGALDAAEADKANLERTISDLRDVMSENGLAVDEDGNVSHSAFERIAGCRIGDMTGEEFEKGLTEWGFVRSKSALEYINRLKAECDYWKSETKIARQDIDEAVKETAKEILQAMINENWAGNVYFMERFARELGKKYGVEVK